MTTEPELGFSEWTALAAVLISLGSLFVSVWTTRRERRLRVVRNAHRETTRITQRTDDLTGGLLLRHEHEALEGAFTESRRVFARNRRHLKRADRKRLGRTLAEVDDRDLVFQNNADEEELYDDLARRRADKHLEFIRVLSRVLDRAAHPGLRDEDLPPDE